GGELFLQPGHARARPSSLLQILFGSGVLALAILASLGHVVEQHHEVHTLISCERNDVDVDGAPTAVRTYPNALVAYRRLRLARRLQRVTERVQEPLAGHLEQVDARLTGRRCEIRTGLPAVLDDVTRLIDDDARWRVALLNDVRRRVLDGLATPALIGRRA